MATAKKKPAAKRTVKYAAKTQSSAAAAAARATSSAWVNNAAQKSAADWQKDASEWAKQSAKLYQLPFGQNDASKAAKNAAETVKSATDNFVKMGTDMMQQLFGAANTQKFQQPSFDLSAMFKSAPSFDPASVQEKFTSLARESAEHVTKSTTSATRAAEESVALSRENIQALVEVTNIATTVSKELAAELVSYVNKLFSQNVELSKQLLTCRTLNDMFDLSTRITKANLDAFFSESVKVSEMVFQCANDVSEPLNERVSETNERITKVIAS